MANYGHAYGDYSANVNKPGYPMTDPNIAELRATAQQMREEHKFDEKGNVGCRSSDPCDRCYLASNIVMLAERAEQAERERDGAREAWEQYDTRMFEVLEEMRREEQAGKQFEARWLAAAVRIARLPERTVLRAALTTAPARCIGCSRTESELHADDCSHINGTPPLTYEQGIRDVLRIRCVEHFDVPQYNRNEINGGECAACAVEEATNGPDYEPLHDIDGRVVNAPPWSTASAQSDDPDDLPYDVDDGPEEPWCWGPGSLEHETNQCLHFGRIE